MSQSSYGKLRSRSYIASMRAAKAGARRGAGRRLQGAAAVEFALILPLFIVLIMGMIDFGHLFFVVNTMTNAAREGARRGSVAPSGQETSYATTAATSYLSAAGLGTGCPLDCPTVQTPQILTDSNGQQYIEVKLVISGTFQNITGFSYSLPGFGSPFASMTNLQAVSNMRLELQ